MMIFGIRQPSQQDIRAMITTTEKSALREKILDACIAQKQSLIHDLKVRMKSLLESDGLGMKMNTTITNCHKKVRHHRR